MRKELKAIIIFINFNYFRSISLLLSLLHEINVIVVVKNYGAWRARDSEFLIYRFIYSYKLAYLQLITVLVWVRGAVLPKVMNKVTYTFSKNFEKHLWMKPFLEPAALLKMNLFLCIFRGFCLKVSEDFSHRIPWIFVVIVNTLRMVFLK